jgi:O-acetyl-ADP-ribose deacetylase (regulator of RNase III)
MKIEFCIKEKEAYEIAKAIFQDIPDISVTQTSITNGIYNVLISAGNSFAEMNGGVDGIINTHLSGYTPNAYIQSKVKDAINIYYMGELPVGCSILVPANHPNHHHLIYTPTMRVAEDVSNTINAYLAFRGTLLLMKKHAIMAASCPLFCTGAGCMSISQACNQMKEAYLSVIDGNLLGKDWPYYHRNHRYLYSFQK